MFGICDSKVQERLLRQSALTLAKTDEICRAAKSMSLQMKVFEENSSTSIHAVKPGREQAKSSETEKSAYRECWNCGYRHEHKKEACPALGKTHNKCNKRNHFAAKCHSQWSVKAVAADKDRDEVFQTGPEGNLNDTQLITQARKWKLLSIPSRHGAQCNVVPLGLYKKATKDHLLKNVTLTQQRITAYGSTTIPVCGTTLLRVWRGDYHCKLDCKLVDQDDIRPILGRKACLGMKIVTYLDNNNLNKPPAGNAHIYAVDSKQAPLTREDVIQRHPLVFGDGVGLLDGEYHIRINTGVDPVQHAPRCVPVAIREQLQSTLEELVLQDIITPVMQPTPWISSLVALPRKMAAYVCVSTHKIKDLNKVIQWEHYPLPAIEEIATRLHGAKLFTTLDIRHGFWHIALDEESSLLTTFNTPFGRYRWKRMPFGINSAPEVFQWRMEDLEGVEVVADDFVVVGFGESQQEASKSHDAHLSAFLKRCEERNLKLNEEKLKLRQTEVPFIGHVATAEGLRVDPHEVQAI